MQPPDVAVFQPYKQWYLVAIQKARYGVVEFLYDLNEIWENALKRWTTIRGFREAGLWLCAIAAVLKKMRTYDDTSNYVAPYHSNLLNSGLGAQELPLHVNLSSDLPKFRTSDNLRDVVKGQLYWRKRLAG
ncbi:hypothetical protein Golomagni_00672 [Golovinomyces magnicellulatus]|nr:hypothetical protein Golomagni_00672 [Golovinomyces magnicellulatus]